MRDDLECPTAHVKAPTDAVASPDDPRVVRVINGKPGDLCAEGDGRPSAEGYWCGACHLAAQKEMESYEADRVEAGIPECDWFERRALEVAVLDLVLEWHDVSSGTLTVPRHAHLGVVDRLSAAIAALQAHRETR